MDMFQILKAPSKMLGVASKSFGEVKCMQEITYDNLIQRLLQAIPEFTADEEDVADHRGTLVFEDLTAL